jgi:hypothetical protein
MNEEGGNKLAVGQARIIRIGPLPDGVSEDQAFANTKT